MTNENGKVIAELAKFIFNAMKVRENARQSAEIIYNLIASAARARKH